MSSVTTLFQSPPAASFPATSITQTCHKCGTNLSHPHPAVEQDAQRRISELEAQVRILTGKATAAVDKLADYEDELRQLKSPRDADQNLSLPPQSPSRPTSAPGNHPNRAHLPSRFSNLLSSSRRAASQPPGTSPEPQAPNGHMPTNPADLLTLLTKEQSLRQAAESRVSQTNEELEELSAQLFTEANEMVAAERKARAKLEERVAILEGRDKEKRGRLEMLESRLGRIERVRGLLSKGQGS